jgi:hypothetical protein
VFGTVDEEGNLRQLAPLELQVTSLQPEQFQAVLEHLLGQREALEQQRAESEGQRAGERNPSRFALEPEAGALPPDGHPARPKGA